MSSIYNKVFNLFTGSEDFSERPFPDVVKDRIVNRIPSVKTLYEQGVVFGRVYENKTEAARKKYEGRYTYFCAIKQGGQQGPDKVTLAGSWQLVRVTFNKSTKTPSVVPIHNILSPFDTLTEIHKAQKEIEKEGVAVVAASSQSYSLLAQDCGMYIDADGKARRVDAFGTVSENNSFVPAAVLNETYNRFSSQHPVSSWQWLYDCVIDRWPLEYYCNPRIGKWYMPAQKDNAIIDAGKHFVKVLKDCVRNTTMPMLVSKETSKKENYNIYEVYELSYKKIYDLHHEKSAMAVKHAINTEITLHLLRLGASVMYSTAYSPDFLKMPKHRYIADLVRVTTDLLEKSGFQPGEIAAINDVMLQGPDTTGHKGGPQIERMIAIQEAWKKPPTPPPSPRFYYR